ncbi:Kinesin light chain [Phytophthora cinnamomi]|uniref:Kinesin light chain n=1 Tax=Phytophthora cinnamomi TaxID=4785 RepID=UPI00355A0CCF|nr:Kinesin light chain [Phytophthora cinnamomi]
MEVVALNERLRADFSPLLKLLPAPYVVSALKSPVSSAKSPAPASSDDRYTQHCRVMLWRLNSYQYGSSSAFLLDLEQLERVAESPETKNQVQSLWNRLAASEGETQAQEGAHLVSNSVGATVPLHLCSGVPGLQEVASIGSEEEDAENQTSWLCNLSLKDQVVTIGTFKTEEEAVRGYEEQRTKMAENPVGFIKLRQLAAKMEQEQRKDDRRVLREALAQCHPRLTTMKVSAVVPPAPAVNNAALVSAARGVARSVAKSLAAASSPAASPAPSETGASPLRPSRASKKQKVDSSSGAAATKKHKVESANNSAGSDLSAGNRSYLKLRRLIQKKLCRHLKGKEVCVVANPEKQEEGRLRASGRLEAGKVFSFRRKKQMTFADYVRDELGRAESACPHMFLVRTRESIDDHLKLRYAA